MNMKMGEMPTEVKNSEQQFRKEFSDVQQEGVERLGDIEVEKMQEELVAFKESLLGDIAGLEEDIKAVCPDLEMAS